MREKVVSLPARMRMRMLLVCLLLACLLLSCMLLGGCGSEADGGLQDGCYTAQMEEESYGWREYVTITVKNGEIVSTEFNAENASGFVKSWDNAYMQNMAPVSGTYPNEYTRLYAAQLTGQTSAPEVEMISGATQSGTHFQALAQAVVQQAIKGDSTIVLVPDAGQASEE